MSTPLFSVIGGTTGVSGSTFDSNRVHETECAVLGA